MILKLLMYLVNKKNITMKFDRTTLDDTNEKDNARLSGFNKLK